MPAWQARVLTHWCVYLAIRTFFLALPQPRHTREIGPGTQPKRGNTHDTPRSACSLGAPNLPRSSSQFETDKDSFRRNTNSSYLLITSSASPLSPTDARVAPLLTKVKRGLKLGVKNVFRPGDRRVFDPCRQFPVGEVGHTRRGPK